jgi:hypothetical protein
VAPGGGTGASWPPVSSPSLITVIVLRCTVFMIVSTWIECTRWSAKNTSRPRLANSSTSAPLTARRGKLAVRLPPDTPTVYSPAAL